MPRGKRLSGWVFAGLILLAPAVRAADEDAIRRAVDRGVTSLQKQQSSNGTWPCIEAPVGATGLAGLTLLECGVSVDDPVVKKAAKAVRGNLASMTHTYSLATAILFLDRLGDPADVPLIQWLGVRLLDGQGSTGGWGYDCPPVGRAEVGRLASQPHPAPKPAPDDKKALPQGIQNLLKQIRPQARPALSDNSNTKFATLALWVARRHGLPVDKALRLVESRFRGSQNADGGWGYLPNPNDRTLGKSFGTMTCAGLLGLAIGHGSAHEMRANAGAGPAAPGAPPPDPTQDPAVRNGLQALGSLIGGPLNNQGNHMTIYNPKGDEYYFLWAVERVAVAYGLDTIGNKDWYAWGSEVLLANQKSDGGWQGRYGGGVDTCFALLFLTRANLSKDLSVILRGREALGEGGAKKGPREGGKPVATKPPSNPAPPAAGGTDVLEAQAARLSAELVQAPEARQRELLAKYKDAKGVVYTQALAAAIPRLQGDSLATARLALAERLARMTVATLRGRLRDDDREMRRAAALACAMKGENGTVPDLIGLLEDPEERVARAAHAALKDLAGGLDFGPKAGASRGERQLAVNGWKDWWRKQQK